MPTVVIDLDGTLCNCDHRIHHAQNKNWDEFHGALMEDEPYLDVVHFLIDVYPGKQIIAVTGRSEGWSELTRQWLGKFNLSHLIDHVIMRSENDFRPDHELKPLALEAFFGSKEATLSEVEFVLDDRDKVVEAWRNYGLPCWQVRNGSY